MPRALHSAYRALVNRVLQERSMSQSDFARFAGVDRSQLNKLLNEEKKKQKKPPILTVYEAAMIRSYAGYPDRPEITLHELNAEIGNNTPLAMILAANPKRWSVLTIATAVILLRTKEQPPYEKLAAWIDEVDAICRLPDAIGGLTVDPSRHD